MSIPRYLGFLLMTMLCTDTVLAEPAITVQQPVTVFTQPGCGECKKAMEFLEKENRRYKEIDIIQSERGYRAFEVLGGVGTPFTLYGDYRLHGFDNDRWRVIFTQEEDGEK